MGLLYISSSLRATGHKVEVYDLGIESISQERLTALVNASDAIGVSVYTNNYLESLELTKKIKEIDHAVPLLIGGPHCIFHKANSLHQFTYADIAVVTEGEEVIRDIAQSLEGKKPLSDVSGIVYRDATGIHQGPLCKLSKNLDSLPFPARDIVEKYEYGMHPWGYKSKQKFTSLLTSRGCMHRCRFCARYNNMIENYGFRQRSAENVVAELQQIQGKYRTVSIVDDNFLADKKRSHQIFDLILKNNIEMDFHIIGARVDSAERSLYEKMKRAGVKFLSYGIESGNQDVLDYYRKNITLDQIRNAVNLGHNMGFFMSASFILGGPIETKKHIENTMKFIPSLPLDTVIIRPFYYELGSDAWTEAVHDGKLTPDEWFVSADSRRHLGNFTSEEIQNYLQRSYKKFYIRPQYIISQLFNAMVTKDYNRLKTTLKVMISSKIQNIL